MNKPLIVTAMAILGLFAVTTYATDTKPLDEAKAKELVQSLTRIGICGNDQQYNFTSVQLAPPVRRIVDIDAKQTTLYPVRTRYTVDCTTGNHNMHYGEVEENHIEVTATFTFARDAFGSWQVLTPSFDDDQYWSDAGSELRCRRQQKAFLTYDSAGKIIKRRPADSSDWGDCGVRLQDATEGSAK